MSAPIPLPEALARLGAVGFDVTSPKPLETEPGVAGARLVPLRDPASWSTEWRDARRALSGTGWWPVFVDGLTAPRDRLYRGGVRAQPPVLPSSLLAEADAILDPWSLVVAATRRRLAETREYWELEFGSAFETAASNVMALDFCGVPEDRRVVWIADLEADLGREVDDRDILRWGMRRALAEGGPKSWYPRGSVEASSHGVPPDGLALVPAAGPGDAAAFGGGEEVLSLKGGGRVALFRWFAARFGAEYAGEFGLGTYFFLDSPPTDPDDVVVITEALFALSQDVFLGWAGNGHPTNVAPWIAELDWWEVMHGP